jgi:hypothetical protein
LTAAGGGQHSRLVRAVWFVAIAAVAWGAGGPVARADVSRGPRAELVISWAPGRPDAVAAAARAARQAGAAAVDATPSAAVVPADGAALRAGRAAYEALRFEEARQALTAAAQSLERTGGAGWSSGELADLFLYRALASVQLGDGEAAWEDFVRAATVDPGRALDPAELPPRAIEQFERARTHVAALPRAKVRLVGGAGCEAAVDGRAVADADLELRRGHHWLVASCPARLPVQRGFDVVGATGTGTAALAGTDPTSGSGSAPSMRTGSGSRPVSTSLSGSPSGSALASEVELELAVAGAPLPAFTDDAALVQARVIGARAVVTVVVTGELAMLRRLGIDGREQERRALKLSGLRTLPSGTPDESSTPSLAALGDEISALLRPEAAAPTTRWYRSRWAWAAAGVIAASAVLVPLMLQDDGPSGVVIRPDGPSW